MFTSNTLNYITLGIIEEFKFLTFLDLFEDVCEYTIYINANSVHSKTLVCKYKYITDLKINEKVVVTLNKNHDKIINIYKPDEFLNLIHKCIFSNYKNKLFNYFKYYVKEPCVRTLNIVLNRIGYEVIIDNSLNEFIEKVNPLKYCKKYNKELYLKLLRR